MKLFTKFASMYMFIIACAVPMGRSVWRHELPKSVAQAAVVQKSSVAPGNEGSPVEEQLESRIEHRKPMVIPNGVGALHFLSGSAELGLASYMNVEADESQQYVEPITSPEAMCEDYFVKCWIGDHWNSAAPQCKTAEASNARIVCPPLMCGSWLERRCTSNSKNKRCDGVALMCEAKERRRANRIRQINGASVSLVSRSSAQAIDRASQALRSSIVGDPAKFMGTQTKLRTAPIWLTAATNESVMTQLRRAHEAVGHSQKLDFIHIPKNAGTAVEEAALAAGVNWGTYANASTVKMRDGLQCHKYHVPPSLLGRPNMFDLDKRHHAFTIVRNPYDRVLSEYRYLLSVDWGESWDVSLREQPECTSEGFNTWLQTVLTRVLQGERHINDCHLLPQIDYVQGQNQRYAKWELGEVLKYEDLPDSFNKLMQIKGLKPRMGRSHNVNGHKKCPKLNSKDLWQSSIVMMNLVYFQDFQAFGYKMH